MHGLGGSATLINSLKSPILVALTQNTRFIWMNAQIDEQLNEYKNKNDHLLCYQAECCEEAE